jgi:hypothetical protein
MKKIEKTYFYMSELDPDAYSQCQRCKKWTYDNYTEQCTNPKCKPCIGDDY